MDNPNKLYNLMNLTEFQKLIGTWIDIEQYFKAKLGNEVVTADFQFVVQTPDYFRKLEEVITLTDKEVLANYIMWNMIFPTMDYLTEGFSKIGLVFYHPARNVKCLEKAKNMMPFVASALFVDRHFPQEIYDKVATGLDEMEQEFINNLDQLSWIDEETRVNLTEKARAMTNLVGYPDWILDSCKLDAKYEALVIVENDFYQNYFNYQTFQKALVEKRLTQPPKKTAWPVNPFDVNGFYYMYENQVIVTAGMLMEPLVSKNFPRGMGQ
ncbi:hypothetical protein Btru_076467 [Bulinus truncatus]|nr:hypothetical protein Btru_076467 [Bulinus truncatus]